MTTNINIRQIRPEDPIPYSLLLLADPSKEMVDRYLFDNSNIYLACQEAESIGVCVLHKLNEHMAEIKNIAINPIWERRGIATSLLKETISNAKTLGLKRLIIGTANASVGQLYLYQKVGFEIEGIKRNFFIDNYPQPIFENGIACKHMIMLGMELSS